MVSQKSVDEQLKAINFSTQLMGKAEVNELPNILHEGEKIFECVNGTYEGGFALLVATNMRLLLVDKKPLKFLTVEDLRFDMINQIDYSHRVFGAAINISTGAKNLRFRSYNQQRLRKLINHIQHRMSEMKMEQSESSETQQLHLEKINQQLQAYLIAQYKHQEELQRQLLESQAGPKKDDKQKDVQAIVEAPLKPSAELADYLYAQGLLAQHQAARSSEQVAPPSLKPEIAQSEVKPEVEAPAAQHAVITPEMEKDLAEAGRQEIFGKEANADLEKQKARLAHIGIEINPMRIAYSKLPMMLRNRKFGRPSFQSHSQATPMRTDHAQA